MGMLVLKIGLLWGLADVIIIATSWYFQTTIRWLCLRWWQEVIVDEVAQGEVI